MTHLLNTLYVTTPDAYVHLENDTVRVDIDHKKQIQVPLHHIGSVVCFGDIMISPALMHRCADEGIGLVLLTRYGRFKARLEGGVSGNILLRQAQHKAANSNDVMLDLCRSIIAGKIQNSRQVLLRGGREAEMEDDSTSLKIGAEELARSLRLLPNARDVDTLRGIEGEAARKYFFYFNSLIRSRKREAFTMQGRNRRPPLDRCNALLSFLYTLITHDCRSALETVGLDPQLGFLHTIRPGRVSLALDLVEEFRAAIADRLVLTLINRGQIDGKDFDIRDGGAVYLKDDARKTVLVAYQERKQEEVMHPLLEKKVAIGLLPFLQARFLARAIRGDMEHYVPFLTR